MPDPLPDLRPRDLGCGHVLHEVVDRGRPDAAQPRFDVLDSDADVHAQAVLGDGPAWHTNVGQLLRLDDDVRPLALELIRARAEHAVEGFGRSRYEIWVRHPRAIEPIVDLALLVLPDLGQRHAVDFGVTA